MKPFITTCIVGDGRYAVNKKSQRRTELFTVQIIIITIVMTKIVYLFLSGLRMV